MENSSKRESLKKNTYKLRMISAKMAGENNTFPTDFEYGDDSVLNISINEKLPSEGSTCLVYKGSIVRNGEKIRQVIVKEFYPLNAESEAKRYSDGKIIFNSDFMNTGLFIKRKQQFIDSFLRQVELSNNEELMEAVVRPECIAVMPGSCSMYIVNDMHNADVMRLRDLKKLDDKLQALLLLSKTMTSLENQGYLLLDLSLENLLYINRPYLKQTMFLDVDSVIHENEINDLNIDRVRISSTYKTPQMALFERLCTTKNYFDEWKELYIDKALNSHEIAVLMSYILFEKRIHSDKEETRNIRNTFIAEKYGTSDELSKKITKFLVGMLNPLEDKRPCKTCEEFSTVLGSLNESYLSEIESKKLNIDSCKYISFNIYNQYPYLDYIENDNTITVNIIGSHMLREAFFDVSITQLQMKDVNLVINLISKDAAEFIESHFAKNPILKRSVDLHDINGERISKYDEEIVDKALCTVHLFDDGFFADKKEVGKKSICLFTDDMYEDELRKISGNSLVFILRDTEVKSESMYGEYILDGRELFEEFTETPYKTDIFNKGYVIHRNYCVSNNPKMSEKDIRAIYEENPYNVWASIRAAVASISRKYEFNKGASIEDLVYSEHLSWTAEAILLGAVPPGTLSEIMDYAYVGNNDWKDKTDKSHIVHPCIASSRSGRRIDDYNWDDIDALDNSIDLDNLDRASIMVYQTMKKIAESNVPLIISYYEMIKNWASNCSNLNEYVEFQNQMDLVAAYERTDRLALTESIDGFVNVISEDAELSYKLKRVVEYLLRIKALFKPVLDFEEYHDFKKADEDVIRVQMQL